MVSGISASWSPSSGMGAPPASVDGDAMLVWSQVEDEKLGPKLLECKGREGKRHDKDMHLAVGVADEADLQ